MRCDWYLESALGLPCAFLFFSLYVAGLHRVDASCLFTVRHVPKGTPNVHISLIKRNIGNHASPATLSSDMCSLEKLLCVLVYVEV